MQLFFHVLILQCAKTNQPNSERKEIEGASFVSMQSVRKMKSGEKEETKPSNKQAAQGNFVGISLTLENELLKSDYDCLKGYN